MQVEEFARDRFPEWLKRLVVSIQGLSRYPIGRFQYLRARRSRQAFAELAEPGPMCRRLLDYDYQLLPNGYVADVERATDSLGNSEHFSGLTIGYPAWNLLYYSIVASLSAKVQQRRIVVIETGTNRGFSTILMAQALKDIGADVVLRTVDVDGDIVEIARENVARAGLSDYVEFNVGDSLAFLRKVVDETPYIDFAFLDDLHEYNHVRKEFDLIYEHIVRCDGKVYFDNSEMYGVRRTLDYIRRAYGGNIIRFSDCSVGPPGNAVWQAD